SRSTLSGAAGRCGRRFLWSSSRDSTAIDYFRASDLLYADGGRTLSATDCRIVLTPSYGGAGDYRNCFVGWAYGTDRIVDDRYSFGIRDNDVAMNRRTFLRSATVGALYERPGGRRPPLQQKESFITDVEGIKVGHFTETRRPTGCTVILCERGAV